MKILNKEKILIILVASLVAVTMIMAPLAFGAEEATVTFDTREHGSPPESVVLQKGDIVGVPADPEDEYYVFAGWYKDEACNVPYDFASAVNSDITLYASWVPFLNASSLFTVSFYTGDESVFIEPQTVKSGSYAQMPAIPEKEGYVFEGWYKDTSFLEMFVFENTRIFHDITLCAKWEEEPEIEIPEPEPEPEPETEPEEELKNPVVTIKEPKPEKEPELVEVDPDENLTCLDLAYWYKGIDEEEYAAKIVAACHSVPTTGTGYCAAWVSYVYQAAGLGFVGGDAIDFWSYYGVSDNLNEIREGMIIAVPHSPTSLLGWEYGHVGVIVRNPEYRGSEETAASGARNVSSGNVVFDKDDSGNEKWLVADSTGHVGFTPLSSWIATYNATNQVRWGWAHYYAKTRINWTGDIPSYVDFVAHESPSIVVTPSAEPATEPETPEEAQPAVEDETTTIVEDPTSTIPEEPVTEETPPEEEPSIQDPETPTTEQPSHAEEPESEPDTSSQEEEPSTEKPQEPSSEDKTETTPVEEEPATPVTPTEEVVPTTEEPQPSTDEPEYSEPPTTITEPEEPETEPSAQDLQEEPISEPQEEETETETSSEEESSSEEEEEVLQEYVPEE